MDNSYTDEIIDRLSSIYDLSILKDEFLHFENPYQILIATILSAQTTDKSVNSVTRELFFKYPGVNELADAEQTDIERIIYGTGFFHAKAKNIIATAKILKTSFNGIIPGTSELLMTLPGVGRKTALIVLENAFGIIDGIAVDTHVKRVSMRLGLTDSSDPVKIEKDLLLIFKKSHWGRINRLFIIHGRRICSAKKPLCERCIISDLCKWDKKSMDRAGIEPAASTMPR